MRRLAFLFCVRFAAVGRYWFIRYRADATCQQVETKEHARMIFLLILQD